VPPGALVEVDSFPDVDDAAEAGGFEVPGLADEAPDADGLPAPDEAAGLPLPSTLAGEETPAEPAADEPGPADDCTVTLRVTVSAEPPDDEQAPASRATESPATTTNFGVRERTRSLLRRSALGDSWRRPASGTDCPAPSARTRRVG